MDITNVDLQDALGNPARITGPDDELIALTLFAAARTILWNMPTADLTIGDSELARNALQEMTAAEQNGNVWNVDPQLHTWTLEQLRTHGPRVFGINAICVVEAME